MNMAPSILPCTYERKNDKKNFVSHSLFRLMLALRLIYCDIFYRQHKQWADSQQDESTRDHDLFHSIRNFWLTNGALYFIENTLRNIYDIHCHRRNAYFCANWLYLTYMKIHKIGLHLNSIDSCRHKNIFCDHLEKDRIKFWAKAAATYTLNFQYF